MSRRLLHVGCGSLTKANLRGFESDDWEEVRFDINPALSPDIIGTITDMSGVADSLVDAVYSAHNVEHVYPHQALRTLSEFHRVLKPDGFLVVTCPDLASVCEALVRVGPLIPLYQSKAGPITALDILYGHIGSVASGNEYMAHKGGFTLESLSQILQASGFQTIHGGRRLPPFYDIWLLAFKSQTTDDVCLQMAARYLP